MGKIIVVGTGFSGTVISREIAEKLNKKVTVIEKRSHVAGNMYDKLDEHGIRIHEYGPHVLVTNKWEIIRYLSQFSKLYKHVVKELSFIDGKYVRLPFNFESVQQLIGEKESEILLAKLRKEFSGYDRVAVLKLAKNNDKDISDFGHLLFEKAYKTYCAKQWNVPTESLDTSILDRVPMAMNYDERYMNKDFQYLPLDGYESLFKNMLDHKNIEIHLNEEATDHLKLDSKSKKIKYDNEDVEALIFTGPIDELFAMKFGELPYRSLRIEYEWFDKDRIYPEEIISYPQADGYTRKTEYKYMMNDINECRGTSVATEYPIEYTKGGKNAPFYPVITEETKQRHEKYCLEAKKYGNIFLCGRLADFRYYNMDDCILHAFEIFNDIKTFFTNKNS